MKQELPNFALNHVAVVGDIMLDRYWYGQTERISPEAPVPVVHVQQQEERPGGAGNVALNLRSLGCQTTLFGTCGKDEAGSELIRQLQAAQIHLQIQQDTQHSTCTKLRILSRNQQLLRLDFEKMSLGLHPSACDNIVATLAHCQALILSDYGKGTLAQPQAWIQPAIALGIPVFVDPKGRDFTRYHGATLLTPNFKEFEAVVGPCPTDAILVEKAEKLMQQEQLQGILITRGKDGMSLVTRDHPVCHFPAMAREVFDVTGAGDTVIATLAAFVAAGKSYAQATEWANFAAGCVVAKLGAATITPEELQSKISDHSTADHAGVLSLKEAISVITSAKQRGESIVFTNGCFDILHAGHVHYLQQAKTFGERLIIAVNDDASVARLKGAGRPINPCAQRMKVLAALGVVDWVIPFSEDTPLNVIKALSPNVLVKGGDYPVDQIVGADFVQAYGGQVKRLDFVDGLSTTQTIQSLSKLISQQQEETTT